MKHILLPGLIFFSTILFAQKQTTDLVTYTPPKGWKKETVANSGVKYTTTNKNSFCVLGIYNSSNSEGTIETDFNREWEELVVNALKPDSVSNKEKGVANNGFENMMGVTTFTFGGTQALAMLSVYSGHGKRTSILVLSNDQEYLNELDIFIASISIKKPDHKIINENNDKGGSAIPLQLMQFDWKQTSNQKDALNNYAGYSTNTYNFKSNNTYQFSRVDFKSYTPKYYLEDEVGTYKVNGNMITLTPSKSYFHVHQRQPGDPVLKSGNLNLRVVQYTFQITIINEKQTLLLTPFEGKETRRDGVFSFWLNGQKTKSYIYYSADKK